MAAVPVISTRHDIVDTLLLTPYGTLSIATSDGQSIPVVLPTAPGDGRDEVARRMASSLSMQIDGDVSMGGRSDGHRVVGLKHSTGSRVTLVYEDGESVRVSVNFTIKDRLVRQCLEAASYAVSPTAFFVLKREVLSRSGQRSSSDSTEMWRTFSETLRGLLDLPSSTTVSSDFDQLHLQAKSGRHSLARRLSRKHDGEATRKQNPQHLANGEKLDPAEAPSILLALHLVAQDCRCLAERQSDLSLLGPIIQDLAADLGLANWWDYWQRLVPSFPSTSPLRREFKER